MPVDEWGGLQFSLWGIVDDVNNVLGVDSIITLGVNVEIGRD